MSNTSLPVDTLIEVCCGSLDDALNAQAGGAHRIELNSSLFLGGLTPSAGTLVKVKERLSIPVFVMIRPRGAGFCYTGNELDVMEQDIEEARKNGADGVVFGVLTATGKVDVKACERLLLKCGSLPAVFHRAVDVVDNVYEALDQIMGLGFKRVLSSGLRPSVPEGLDNLRKMIDHVKGQIEILPGAGIDQWNCADVVRKTGCTQIHIAPFKKVADLSTVQNESIYFGGALYPPEDRFEMIDSEAVAGFQQALKSPGA